MLDPSVLHTTLTPCCAGFCWSGETGQRSAQASEATPVFAGETVPSSGVLLEEPQVRGPEPCSGAGSGGGPGGHTPAFCPAGDLSRP